MTDLTPHPGSELDLASAPGPDVARLILEAWASGQASPRTAATYRHAGAAWLAWCDAAGVDPLQAGRATAERYMYTLRERYAPRTVAKHHGALRSYYGYIASLESVPHRNPWAYVRAPRVARGGTTRHLTPGEVARLLEAASTRPPRDRVLLGTLALTAARVAEVVGADVGDIQRGDGLATLSIVRKGGAEGRVVLPPVLVAVVDDYLADRDNPPGDAPLVVSLSNNSRGRRLSTWGAWDVVRRVGQAAGIELGARPHMLRVSAGTALARELPLHVVQQLLGHASIETTRLYLRTADELADAATAAASLARLYGS